MKTIQKITVAGGGTAGLVSALILKSRFPFIKIEVIRSKKIGIIGVGEGSTEHWNEFMRYVGIDHNQLITECDATFKCGILFKNWGVDDYMHSVGNEMFNLNSGATKIGALGLICGQMPKEFFNPKYVWENKLGASDFEQNFSPFNQYHFNTHKLNIFLENRAKQFEIDLIDDEILDVNLNEDGIKTLVGEKSQYSADFFIDCTGFSKFLIGKFDVKWKSLSQYLTMKSAVTFQTPDADEYNIYTLARGMNSGWMFTIPVWGRHGNGYIYDSDFISKEQAVDEIRNTLKIDIEVGKEFNFDPGYLNNVWVKNCCAVGLSSSFFEPLEATSIGSTIQQVFMLMHVIQNYDEKTAERYNQHVERVFENIRDFIFLHYMGGRKDTDFWRYVANIKPPDSLKENLDIWKNRLPLYTDFSGSGYRMFNELNFTQVLHALGMFNIESLRKEYNSFPPLVRSQVDQALKAYTTRKMFNEKIGHKEFIKRVRNRYIFATTNATSQES